MSTPLRLSARSAVDRVVAAVPALASGSWTPPSAVPARVVEAEWVDPVTPTPSVDMGVLARLVVHTPMERIREHARNRAWVQRTLAEVVESARIEGVQRGGAVDVEVMDIVSRYLLLSHGPDPDDPATYVGQIEAVLRRASVALATRELS